jgi:WD40 repeat protein
MTTFMPPPPAATFLAFHPQDNNIIAIGMEDSTIQIYNVRVDEVKSKLKGHQKRITGLAFSNALNVLVSSGADAQVLVFRSLSITSMYEDPVLQKIVLSSMEFWLHISLVPPGRMCLFSYFLLLHGCPRCFCQNEVSTVTLLTQMM